MENVYDNGTMVLGTVKKIKKYLITNKEVVEDFDNIMEDLEDLHDDDIVAINYDLGMGYTMDYWTKLDKLKGFNMYNSIKKQIPEVNIKGLQEYIIHINNEVVASYITKNVDDVINYIIDNNYEIMSIKFERNFNGLIDYRLFLRKRGN